MLKRWCGLIIIYLVVSIFKLFFYSFGSHENIVLLSVQCVLAFIILKMAKHEEITNCIKSRITQFHPEFTIRIGWFCCFWGPLVALTTSLPSALSDPTPDQRLNTIVHKLDDVMDDTVDLFIYSMKQQKSTEDKQKAIEEIIQKDPEAIDTLALIYSRSDEETINLLILEALAKHTQQPLAETYKPDSPRKTKKALIKQMQQWVKSKKDIASQK
tara:strand:+ start:110 stop:751 length:642 start_codon:yes stop_codon:yes gene_type:complete